VMPGWWREVRTFVDGAPLSLDEAKAAKWSYGLETVETEYKTIEVDTGTKKAKRRLEWRIVTQPMTCESPAGRSIWRRIVREPVGHDGERGVKWRLVQTTVAHRVDNAGAADTSPIDERTCSQRRLAILRQCLGEDLFSWLRMAFNDWCTLEEIGVGRDSKARSRSGADRVRTAMRRALRVYVAITWAESHGQALDPSWWTGIGYAGAIIRPMGCRLTAANDNGRERVAA